MLNYQRVQRAFFQNMSLKHVVRTPQNEVDLLLAFASSTANGAFCSLRPWWLGLHQVAEGGSHGSHSDPIRMTLGKPRQCFTWVFFCSFDVFSMVKVALFDVKNMKVIFLSFSMSCGQTLTHVLVRWFCSEWYGIEFTIQRPASWSSAWRHGSTLTSSFNGIAWARISDAWMTSVWCWMTSGSIWGLLHFIGPPPFFIGLKKSPNPWIIWVWINTY